MILRWRSFKDVRHIAKSEPQICLRKRYSTARSSERVTIPCQSNDHIALHVYWPLSEAISRNVLSSVLVYLPRGPYLASEKENESTIEALRSRLSCPIVQINYRWDKHQKFPTPVHDVLAGYDWVLENLLPKRAISRPGRADHVGRVALCGELVGGGLATALALTECRVGEPGVVAAAINNPLIDWVSLSETKSVSKGSASKRIGENPPFSETQDLLSLRQHIFKRPVDYFDQFASPILFFRSAGAEVPREPVASFQTDMEQLSVVERNEFLRQYGAEDRATPFDRSRENNETTKKAPRKASKRFPSKSFGLRLPSFYITSGSMSPLNGQAGELTTLLRQSITRQSKYASSNARDFGRKVLIEGEDEEMDDEERHAREVQEAEAVGKARFNTHDGDGLWDSSADGRARVLAVARWLHDSLR